MDLNRVLIVLIATTLFGCDPPQGSDTDTGTVSQVSLKDLPIKVDWQIPLEPICTEPKPPNIGCTTLCKPCVTFDCRDGEWVRVDIETPDFICNPEGPILGGDISACPRQSGMIVFAAIDGFGDDFGSDDIPGFCPAECSFCY